MPPTPVYQSGDVILVLFPYSDLRTAKLRPALIVLADDFHTGLHQVAVAMITSRLFRPKHLRRINARLGLFTPALVTLLELLA
jgi:mRNA interferase MazF